MAQASLTLGKNFEILFNHDGEAKLGIARPENTRDAIIILHLFRDDSDTFYASIMDANNLRDEARLPPTVMITNGLMPETMPINNTMRIARIGAMDAAQTKEFFGLACKLAVRRWHALETAQLLHKCDADSGAALIQHAVAVNNITGDIRELAKGIFTPARVGAVAARRPEATPLFGNRAPNGSGG